MVLVGELAVPVEATRGEVGARRAVRGPSRGRRRRPARRRGAAGRRTRCSRGCGARRAGRRCRRRAGRRARPAAGPACLAPAEPVPAREVLAGGPRPRREHPAVVHGERPGRTAATPRCTSPAAHIRLVPTGDPAGRLGAASASHPAMTRTIAHVSPAPVPSHRARVDRRRSGTAPAPDDEVLGGLRRRVRPSATPR